MQDLDNSPGCNVPVAPVHEMERLAMLVGAGVRVGVVVDGLQCPLGILELHLFILVLLFEVFFCLWCRVLAEAAADFMDWWDWDLW
jgi:hypothetical protein